MWSQHLSICHVFPFFAKLKIFWSTPVSSLWPMVGLWIAQGWYYWFSSICFACLFSSNAQFIFHLFVSWCLRVIASKVWYRCFLLINVSPLCQLCVFASSIYLQQKSPLPVLAHVFMNCTFYTCLLFFGHGAILHRSSGVRKDLISICHRTFNFRFYNKCFWTFINTACLLFKLLF